MAELGSALPHVLDGDPAGVHDARIATRRLRELLPLLGDHPGGPGADHLGSRLRRLGRSLGRVRDADVRIALLASLERRIPLAAPALVLGRQERERRRLHLVRKLIKKIERLDAVRFAASSHAPAVRLAAAWPAGTARWRHDLRRLVAERARSATAAVDHATGVYFPNRVHAARIAIKKLRYALEIVHATELADCNAALAVLKKTQDLLGDLHDRQDLLDHFCADAAGEGDPGGRLLLRQVIEAEARHLHARYLDRRADVLDACRAALTAASPIRPVPQAALAAGAIVVSSGLLIASRLRSGHHDGH